MFVHSDTIRSAFSDAMSAMYRAEVPLYGDLLAIVDDVNAAWLAAHPEQAATLSRQDAMTRLGSERHGAIRVGTAAELALLRRAFAVMGMYPVGYYDLSVAGVPVHSTAFRPIDSTALARNPFRVFTSLLRLELIEDAGLRTQAEGILALRRIVSETAEALIEQCERDGGLDDGDAADFVTAILETFRWHGAAQVNEATYDALLASHRLIADIVSFKGPHINHLTPRTLDIDAAQAAMLARGIEAKDVIEGPPRRAVPILLRQTSFTALAEPVTFAGAQASGTHTARFGEIEQRGVALTPKGRALYDELLNAARATPDDYADALVREFARFPDDHDTLRREGLAYYAYHAVGDDARTGDLEEALAAGTIEARPITYEDFLPVSAAGIFQSNLRGDSGKSYAANSAQDRFEAALGARVADPFALYAAQQQASLAALRIG